DCRGGEPQHILRRPHTVAAASTAKANCLAFFALLKPALNISTHCCSVLCVTGMSPRFVANTLNNEPIRSCRRHRSRWLPDCCCCQPCCPPPLVKQHSMPAAGQIAMQMAMICCEPVGWVELLRNPSPNID